MPTQMSIMKSNVFWNIDAATNVQIVTDKWNLQWFAKLPISTDIPKFFSPKMADSAGLLEKLNRKVKSMAEIDTFSGKQSWISEKNVTFAENI